MESLAERKVQIKMSRYLLSSLLAAALASAPAVLAQESGQRDQHKTSQSQTQDKTDAGARDRVRSGEQASGTAQLRNNERQFLMDASQDSLLEIELGKLAQERGSSPDVKEYGERMVEEHSKALDKAKSTASGVNVTIPEDLQAKHKTTVDRFSKMSGEEFDRAYMQHMVRDHKKAVNLFERTSKNARNEEVKNYASEALPTLRDHLEQAQKLHMQVSGKGTASRQRDESRTAPSDATDEQGAAGTKRDQKDTTRKP